MWLCHIQEDDLRITDTRLVMVLGMELELEMHRLFKTWRIKPNFSGMVQLIISNCYPWHLFQNELEMNGNIINIIAMMKNDSEYKRLYKQAFEDGEINSENMLKALAQFMTMLTSSNSRFDKYRRSEPGGILSSDELEGYQIFNQNVLLCHATDLFTDNSFQK